MEKLQVAWVQLKAKIFWYSIKKSETVFFTKVLFDNVDCHFKKMWKEVENIFVLSYLFFTTEH